MLFSLLDIQVSNLQNFSEKEAFGANIYTTHLVSFNTYGTL